MFKKLQLFLLFLFSVNISLVAQNKFEITYISNEGFLLKNKNSKILIDALFNTLDGEWCDSPSKETVHLMENALPPFDNVDIIAITHRHVDHFDNEIVSNHMLNNKNGIVLCPEQVELELSKSEHYGSIKSRIVSVTPELYRDTAITVKNIKTRVLRLEHSHYMEHNNVTGEKVNKHRKIENLGYLFDVDGIKYFHCGDTNPRNEKEYFSFKLSKEKIDVAFLERIFYSSGPKGIKIIEQYIDPGQIVLMHIGPQNQTKFAEHFKDDGNVHIFKNKMNSTILTFE